MRAPIEQALWAWINEVLGDQCTVIYSPTDGNAPRPSMPYITVRALQTQPEGEGPYVSINDTPTLAECVWDDSGAFSVNGTELTNTAPNVGTSAPQTLGPKPCHFSFSAAGQTASERIVGISRDPSTTADGVEYAWRLRDDGKAEPWEDGQIQGAPVIDYTGDSRFRVWLNGYGTDQVLYYHRANDTAEWELIYTTDSLVEVGPYSPDAWHVGLGGVISDAEAHYGDLRHELRGFYTGTASVQLFNLTHTGYLETLRASMASPDVLLSNEQRGLVVRDMGAVLDVPEPIGTEWQRRRNVDVAFAYAEHQFSPGWSVQGITTGTNMDYNGDGELDAPC